MFTPYQASEAKAAADEYYRPLNTIFDFIRTNAKNGMYAALIGGIDLSSAQLEVLQKCGYTVEVQVDEKEQVKYYVSWDK